MLLNNGLIVLYGRTKYATEPLRDHCKLQFSHDD